MKKLLGSVFGVFGVVMLTLGILNTIQFKRVERYQTYVNQVDLFSQQFAAHAETVQAIIQSPRQWDHSPDDRTSSLSNAAVFWDPYLLTSQKLLHQQEFIQLLPRRSWAMKLKAQQVALQQIERNIHDLTSRIGFKEYGQIGQLRTIVHALETNFPEDKARILSMRRHEKDFLMRCDSVYIRAMEKEWQAWSDQYSLPHELHVYQQTFYGIVFSLDSLFSPRYGAAKQWKDLKEQHVQLFRVIRSELLHQNQTMTAHMTRLTVWTTVFLVSVCIVVAFLFSLRLTRTVIGFEQQIHSFIESSYSQLPRFERFPANEIGRLMTHFQHLSQKINSDVRQLEERVARRTVSIQQKNRELEQKQQEVDQSMRYAQDLQRTLLADPRELAYLFGGCQLFFQPKERVGGDFYWSKHLLTDQRDLRYFALADCTGHGVSGALLGVIGMHALDEIVSEQQSDPGQIVNLLREYISQRLNRNNIGRQDGLDLALICYDRREQVVHFAGAHMSLWLLRAGRIIEARGQRMPVGWSSFERASFSTQSIQLEENDRMVLFSDGVVHQFGGPNNKKWGKKNFRSWILEQSDRGELNGTEFARFFEAWTGTQEQTDDCAWVALGPVSRACVVQQEFALWNERERLGIPTSTE